MAYMQQALALGWTRPGGRHPRRWHSYLQGSERTWAIAFVVPYMAVLLVFAAYPVAYGLWMASAPSLYAELFTSDEYGDALVTTLLYVGVGVNITMFLSLLLSGFFMRRRWWIKALLVLSMLPWALPAQPAFISIHWMLIYPGYIDALCWHLFGFDGPDWFNNYWSALGSNILASTWKTMPFWTIILLAGRMAVPQELYEAAAVDGATGLRRFAHVTLPLMANLYVVCVLLDTIFALGDFNSTYFVSGGGPAMSTEVLATLAIRYAFTTALPRLGVATVMTALPLLIPLVFILMRKLRMNEVQL